MQPSPLARYLLAAYGLLIMYASLHPFTGWRDNGVAPFDFLFAPSPRYITAFDLTANVAAYVPFGFLAVLAFFPALRGIVAVLVAVLAAAALSLSLEALQNYLPSRIASNLDVGSNACGAVLGALLGAALSGRLLREAGLHALRYQLFKPGGRVDLGLVLLGLWLVSQLNPETLLFGTGDLRGLLPSPSAALHPPEVFIRVEAGVAGANTIAVGLLVASLVERNQPVRLYMLLLLLAALLVRTVAFGTLINPQDMFAWLTPGAAFGVAAGALVAVIACSLPLPGRLALSALALMAATALVNFAPGNPYLTASLAVWRQGHFLNFNGLTRIVSAIWPFCVLPYLMLTAGERGRHR